MRYARDTKSLSDIMEKELKLLDKDHIHYMIETEDVYKRQGDCCLSAAVPFD